MVPMLAGEPEVIRQRLAAQSDPQPEEPSEVPGQPLRWLATPSVGTMLGLALLGVDVVAASRARRGKPETTIPQDRPLALPAAKP